MGEMIGIEGLENLGMHIIISKLDPNDTASLCCVSKKFNVWASDDSFWAIHCSNDLNLSSPVDPFGNHSPNFKIAYQLWKEAFRTYPTTLVRRAKRCWDTITSWLNSNFPEALATLRRGATEEDLNEVEKILKIKLPLPTRLLYRFHDGQEFSQKLFGLIGGYIFCDHLVNVHLLPLKHVILATMNAIHDVGLSSTSKYVSIAASVTGNEKLFSLNCANGQLHVGKSNLREDGEMMPCVPKELLKSSGDQHCDGLLLWLEEHGRRLQSGMIALRGEGDFRSISQFPEKSPLCTTAVTNGVQVRASAVLIPEQRVQALQGSVRYLQSPGFLFAFSVRMSLLPEGCSSHGMKFNSCQLHTRHLIIRENERVMGDINAEAVIGKYPLLLSGEQEFVYESCSTQHTKHGSIEGSFTFIPGRLDAPKGDPFKVEITQLKLDMPDYIF